MAHEAWYQDKIVFSGMGSFPSDNATLVTLFVVILFSINRRLGYIGLIYLVVAGTLRVSLGYHWPTDVAGGIGLGALAGYVGLKVEQRFRVGISDLLRRLETHASLTYPLGFLFLFEFASGFQHASKLAYELLKFRLFH
jgi:membrane-associated phospholipid phosphatase